MILTRTPLRISFVGGGSDLRAFYKDEPGAVVSTAINKYIYITAGKHWNPDRVRVSYSTTENVMHADELMHDLVRHAMLLTENRTGVEITSIADIPSRGSGLGSSSAYVIGVLNALYRLGGIEHPNVVEALAHHACQIEIDILGKPIGKQDQYACAYGGLNFIQFNPDESVIVTSLDMDLKDYMLLQERLMLFYTGIIRGSDGILAQQSANTKSGGRLRGHLRKMVTLAHTLRHEFEAGNVDALGPILAEGWERKKKLSPNISNSEIDGYIEKGINAGASGGKLLGAGGGGFLLFYVKPEYKNEVREALHLRHVPIKIGVAGSTCLLNDQMNQREY